MAAKLKSLLLSFIASQQTAYVKNRCIGERGRLFSDILDFSDKLMVDCYLFTVHIEKNFDSLNHGFFLVVLKKFGFGNNFID